MYSEKEKDFIKRIREAPQRKHIEKIIIDNGLKFNPTTYIIIRIVAVFVPVLIAAIYENPIAAVIGAFLGYYAFNVYVKRCGRKFKETFFEQSELFFLQLASNYNISKSLRGAFLSTLPSMNDPLKSELEIIKRNMVVAKTLPEAVKEYLRRRHNSILEMFYNISTLEQTTGSNIKPILIEEAEKINRDRLSRQEQKSETGGIVMVVNLMLYIVPIVLVFNIMTPSTLLLFQTTGIGSFVIVLAFVAELFEIWRLDATTSMFDTI